MNANHVLSAKHLNSQRTLKVDLLVHPAKRNTGCLDEGCIER